MTPSKNPNISERVKMFNNIIHTCFLFITVLIMTVATTSCDFLSVDKKTKTYIDPVKIGLAGTAEGGWRVWQEAGHFAAYLAAEEINDAGGLTIGTEQREIQLVEVDHGASGTTGIAAFQQLLDQDIRIVIGPSWSGVAYPSTGQGVIHTNNTASSTEQLIMTTATSPVISSADTENLVWRLVPSDALQGKAGVKYLENASYLNLTSPQYAILYQDDSWGQGIRDAIKANCTDGTTDDIAFDSGATDFSTQLADVFDTDAGTTTVLYIVAYSGDGINIANALATSYLTQTQALAAVICTVGMATDDLLTNANSTIIDGWYGTTPQGNTSDSNFNSFKTNYTNRFGFAPQSYGECYYDTVYVLAYAMMAANSVDYSAVRNQLDQVSKDGGSDTVIGVNDFTNGKAAAAAIDYNGASGNIEFDGNGDPTTVNFQVWRIQNNAFTDVVQITP
ncbi:MAG: amino acid ABC transporter substrate-binding protein [bacterium]|nr:amino acid ABC transporter substrate-binding protein [bacterium]